MSQSQLAQYQNHIGRGLQIAGLLGRAVDQTGMVLITPALGRRDEGAAKRLLRKLLKRPCRLNDHAPAIGAGERVDRKRRPASSASALRHASVFEGSPHCPLDWVTCVVIMDRPDQD
jgi:hypothetical protein